MATPDLAALRARMAALSDAQLAAVLGPARDDYTDEAVAVARVVLDERQAGRTAEPVSPVDDFVCDRCRSTRARARSVRFGGSDPATFVVVACQRCGLAEWFDAGADRPGLRPSADADSEG